MKRLVIGALLSAATLLAACAAAAVGGLQRALVPISSIPLPGGTSRFDYQSIDPKRRLLFVAHLGESAIDVIDLRTDSVRAVIRNISQVHGVLVVPELGRVYATATGNNQLAVIDERSLRVIAHVPTGEYPDGLTYAYPEHKLYISDETGGADTVVDVHTNQRIATISLGGEAGNTQFDPASGRIFVNAQTGAQLIEIDPRRDSIVGRTHLPYCNSNHGLLINTPFRIAYIACEGNAALLTYDMRSHKVKVKDSVGDRPDVLALDTKKKRLYVGAESGIVAAFVVGPDGSPSKIGMGFLAPGAHTVSVDPATGHVYFPIQSAGGGPVLKVFRAGDGE